MKFKGSIHVSKGVSGGPIIGVTDRKVYGILIGISFNKTCKVVAL